MRDMTAGSTSDNLGKLLLRLTLSILILLHGVAKIVNGVDPIMGMVTNIGLPPSFAYLVFVGEVIAPLFILIGAWTRLAALIVAINMVFAIVLVHMGDLLKLTKTGGWALELQAMFLMTAIAVAFLGAGRYSAGGVNGRWN